MKSIIQIILITAFLQLFSLLSIGAFAVEADLPLAENISCEEAQLLACQSQTSFSSNFDQGGEALIDPASCITPNQNLQLREFWFKVDLSGALSYFLDGDGVNVGFEVYSGSCKNLELVSCYSANENNTYIYFYGSGESEYFVRALGYNYDGESNFQVSLNCFTPPPPCILSIEEIEIAPCANSEGMVEIELAGLAEGNPNIDFVTCEIQTDGGLFFFDGARDADSWQIDAEISGTSIIYINVVCGNSENYCSDVVNNISLPLVSCETPGTGNLVGTTIWDANCTPRLGKVSFYQPGTNQLQARYDVVIQNNGHFIITDPLIGEFDILVKIDGCLAEGYEDMSVSGNATNFLECGLLRRGEVSNDNFVNVADLSTVNNWFNQAIPDGSLMNYLDLNCDGIVNVVELSVINSSFGMVGDVVPLD